MATAEAHSTHDETRGESFLLLMSTGIVALTALIAFMGVVGEWWLLAATFATLLATTGLVVLAISRLLGQSGDEDQDTVVATATATADAQPRTGRMVVGRPAASAL